MSREQINEIVMFISRDTAKSSVPIQGENGEEASQYCRIQRHDLPPCKFVSFSGVHSQEGT